MQQRRSQHAAFTLIELCLILLILSILAGILYPVFAQGKTNHQSVCLSNLKQISLAIALYAQDYNECLPPVAQQTTLPDGKDAIQSWGADATLSPDAPGIISDYLHQRESDKRPHLFQCPNVKNPVTFFDYMYNDLAAGRPLQEMTMPSLTALMIDSDDSPLNFGHARATRPSEILDAAAALTHSANQSVVTHGAAVSDAALNRHRGFCNVAFADGHVKGQKSERIFFAPRNSRNESHIDPETRQAIGPDPGGKMTFQDKSYTATFHIR